MLMNHSGQVLCGLVVVCAVGFVQAKPDQAGEARLTSFERIKSLAGTWEGTSTGTHEGDNNQVVVTYDVTAGGSAVIETMFADTDHEMVTVYHMDGGDLMLTHYCMLGNQPKMVAQSDTEDNAVTFVFTEGANIDSEHDPHMHQVVHQFLDDDHIQSQWTMFQDGQPAETVTLDLHRPGVDAPTNP